jgi:uracil phosphoribosyltransferase
MLATGHSAAAALRIVSKYRCRSLKFVCLVAAPEGVTVLQKEFSNIPVYTAALDQCLNEHGYIVPGLGDAGDRLYGTK